MTRSVLYTVSYGVNTSHLFEFAGSYDKLKDAKKVYDTLPMIYPFKAKRITRLSFPNKWEGANDVRTVEEGVA